MRSVATSSNAPSIAYKSRTLPRPTRGIAPRSVVARVVTRPIPLRNLNIRFSGGPLALSIRGRDVEPRMQHALAAMFRPAAREQIPSDIMRFQLRIFWAIKLDAEAAPARGKNSTRNREKWSTDLTADFPHSYQ